jgi:hypothetical protein
MGPSIKQSGKRPKGTLFFLVVNLNQERILPIKKPTVFPQWVFATSLTTMSYKLIQTS